MNKHNKLQSAMICVVTDYGEVVVPLKVMKRYRDVYFRKRARKKSEREALSAIERDVHAMMHYAWLMDKDFSW
jgi:hypothetical protein